MQPVRKVLIAITLTLFASDSLAIKIVPKPEFIVPVQKFTEKEIIFKPVELPIVIEEKIVSTTQQEKRIELYNVNTLERLDIIFWNEGKYVEDSMEKINKFLRDRRSGEVTKMDPELIMLLFNIVEKVGYDGEVNIISAYRSEETNSGMKKLGRRVANKSMHSQGKAIDISMKDIPLKAIYDAALAFGVGGVSLYDKEGFVHIDTGAPRVW